MYIKLLFGIASGCFASWIYKRIAKMNSTDEESDATSIINTNEPYRMILVVNKELKMGDGKIVAQCSHAAVGIYETYFKKSHSNVINAWESQGKPMAVYVVDDTKTIKSLYKSARSREFMAYLVKDAGLTQIPTGSATVLAVGPEKSSVLEPIVESLQLKPF